MNKVMSKTLIAIIGKNISYTIFYLVSSRKSGSGTQLMRVYNDKIDVAVSPCTKIESVYRKYKKTQARKVQNTFLLGVIRYGRT